MTTDNNDRAALAELIRLAGVCPELNLSNYGPDDVDELNGWAIEVAQEIDRLAAAPQAPAAPEALLTKPATVGSGTFQAGVKERLVIEAAQRQYEWTQSPEGQAARAEEMKRTAPFLAELQAITAPEAPKGEPTMADAIAAGDGTLHGAIDYWQARALAAEAPKAEPVAWQCKDFADGWILFNTQLEAAKYQKSTGCLMQPLYTTPQPKRVPLTDEQIEAAGREAIAVWVTIQSGSDLDKFARAIERAHGITGEAE